MSKDSKLRVSQHSGREGSAKHNDRSFLEGRSAEWIQEHADHIDITKTHENRVWTWDGSQDIEASERTWYAQTYGAAQETTNRRYIQERHPDRCKTTDQLYEGKLTRPEEMILQIGDMHSDVDLKAFMEAVDAYVAELVTMSKAYGDHMHILSLSIHFDESSPHVHLRRVWDYTDRDGLTRLGQDKALEAMGVPLPDPSKPKSRYNHRKVTFDKVARGVWQQICKDHGFDIETEPRPDRKHKAKADYIRDQISQEIDQAQRQAHEAAQRAQEVTQEADKAALRAVDAEKALQRSESLLKASQGKLQGAEARLQALTDQEAQAQAKAAEAEQRAQEAQAQIHKLQQDAQEARDSLQDLGYYKALEQASGDNGLIAAARDQAKKVPLRSGWSMLPDKALEDLLKLSDSLWKTSRTAKQAYQDKVLAEDRASRARHDAEVQYSMEYRRKELDLVSKHKHEMQQLSRYRRMEEAFPQIFDQMADRLREIDRQQDHDRGYDR